MKRLLLCLGLMLGVCQDSFAAANWFTNLPDALLRAKGEKRPVLVYFSGSDWSETCMKLQSKVFDQQEFALFAQANLILVQIDFPHHHTLAPDVKAANKKVAHDYGVSSVYPALVLLNGSGERIGGIVYMGGGPKQVIEQLQRYPAMSGPTETKRPSIPATFDPPPSATPMKYGDLALKSISGPKNRRIVLINDQSLMVGETGKVQVRDVLVELTVKEIRDDSVTVIIAGKPTELKIREQ